MTRPEQSNADSKQRDSEPVASATRWGDPGYFRPQAAWRNAVRVLWQLIHPPRGHRIRITKPGGMLILVALGIGSAAFNTSQNILYIVLALLLSTLLLSGLLSWMNFKGSRWRLVTEQHMRVGEATPVRVEVENTKRYLPTYALAFALRAQHQDEQSRISLPERLEPGALRTLDWWLKPTRRGAERMEIAGVVSQFPFGFLRKTIEASCWSDVIIWPERMPYEFNPGAGRERSQQGGSQRAHGSGVELLKIRAYRAGDPIRQVHWRASARQRQLMIKETTDERQPRFSFYVDADASRWRIAAEFERMCAFAGTLIEDCHLRGQCGEVRFSTGEIFPMHGIGDLYGVLDRLATLEPQARAASDASAALIRGSVVEFAPMGDGSKRVMCLVEGAYAGAA